MRVDGVAPSTPYHSELRRSEPRGITAPNRIAGGFQDADVIFDLTVEAMIQTGRKTGTQPRRPHIPPETYTDSGTLAYHTAPEILPVTAAVPMVKLKAESASSSSTVTLVSFDGMLHAPAREQIRLLGDR